MNSPKSLKSPYKKRIKPLYSKEFKQRVISVIRVLVKVERKINILSNKRKNKKNGKSAITAVTLKNTLMWEVAVSKERQTKTGKETQ
jgi:hypothetical protein